MPPILDAYGSWPMSKIALRTRKDNDIDNFQPWTLSRFEWSMLGDQCDRFEKIGAAKVAPECPVYNCHGLTFGNRRTSVGDSPELFSLILEDDGFRQIYETEANTGDVVLYYDADGKVTHSGLVLKRGDPPFHLPLIWSKWGKAYEMTHLVTQCPYDVSNRKYYRLKIWKPEQVFRTSQ
jgi:hypothetical protein